MTNFVILTGNTGSEPEIKTFENGGKQATFSFATTDGPKDNKKTEWHNIVINGKLADIVEQYVHKGKKLVLVGSIRSREWTDKNNIKRRITNVVCDKMEMLGDSAQNKAVKPDDIPALTSGLEDSVPFPF